MIKKRHRAAPDLHKAKPAFAGSDNPVGKQGARSIVIGLGNPFLSDDGVGPMVARRVHEILDSPDTDLCELASGGVELMETMVGYRSAVIIDALLAGKGTPGACYLLDLQHCPPTRRVTTSHEIGLLEGLELGRRLGLAMPDSVSVYAIEVVDPLTFGTEMTGAVKGAIPRIAQEIATEISMGFSNTPAAMP
jgi:hydrogenase maturation protease